MRSAALPDLPTVAESGFPGFEATSWNALLAPADAARRHRQGQRQRQRLSQERQRQEDLAKFEMQAAATPQDLKAFMASEVAKWGPIIKAANITME